MCRPVDELGRNTKSWISGNSKKKAKRFFAIDLDNEYKNLLRLKFDKASSYILIKEV